jgi:hypothetical protein
MSGVLDRRMDRLEEKARKVVAAGAICIWCARPDEFDTTVDLLVAAGWLAEADRSRCIYWGEIKQDDLKHEDHLRILEACEMLAKADEIKAGIVDWFGRPQPGRYAFSRM